MPQETIGVIANTEKPLAAEALWRLLASFEGLGLRAILDERTGQVLPESPLPRATLKDLGGRCSLLVVLGGDGTLLGILHQLTLPAPPILGVNLGALGFLTCTTQQSLEQIGDWIARKNYQVCSRDIIQAEVLRGDAVEASYLGVNEVAILRGSVSRIIQLEARINGSFINRYNADGLIVATPTGSTAYSLSAGGPIIDPESDVFVITPICPHALSNRSIVVPSSGQVDIIPVKARDEILLTLDGQTLQTLEASCRVRVSKAPHTVRLAFPPEQTFYDTLHQKMHWYGSNVG